MAFFVGIKALAALNPRNSGANGILPFGIKALAMFNWTNRGVNGIFCRYKGINGV